MGPDPNQKGQVLVVRLYHLVPILSEVHPLTPDGSISILSL